MKVYETVGEVPLPAYGKGDMVAIKLHMGERGNLHYVRPEDVAVLVDRIREMGARVFIGDTTTLYKRKRVTATDYLETAAQNGFTEEHIGCPIIIADESGGRRVGDVEIAEGFLRANSLLAFSHATGHITTGFAGAIKNIAMGCATRAGKRYIHSPGCQEYDEEKCAFCGDCVEACPFNFITLDDGIEIDLKDCPACSRCLTACKNGALFQPEGAMVECYRRYAETCRAILDLFESTFFINDLRRITKFCDCTVNSEPIISADIGLIADEDPIKIDSESVDIISGKSPGSVEVFGEKWRDFIGHVSRFMEASGPVE